MQLKYIFILLYYQKTKFPENIKLISCFALHILYCIFFCRYTSKNFE